MLYIFSLMTNASNQIYIYLQSTMGQTYHFSSLHIYCWTLQIIRK